jgi:hypothetical protein
MSELDFNIQRWEKPKRTESQFLFEKAKIIKRWRKDIAEMKIGVLKMRKIDNVFLGIISRLEGIAESLENQSDT